MHIVGIIYKQILYLQLHFNKIANVFKKIGHYHNDNKLILI